MERKASLHGDHMKRFCLTAAILVLATSNLRAQLNAYFVNVGQGDATYIELPNGTNLLIDGGPSGEAIYQFLKSKGVTKIDNVVLTHPHNDHYRGLKKVFSAFDVKNFYDTKAENIDAKGDNNLRELADAEPSCKTHFPEVGTTLDFDRNVTIKVLNSCTEQVLSHNNDVINNCSLVLRLYYNGHGILLMGDAEAAVENAMAKTPESAMGLMEAVWKPAIAQVAIDVAAMQAIVDSDAKVGGASFKIEPWDYRYYAEKVRKAKYDLDMNEGKPYMQLDKLREAMFWASGEVYGFQYQKVEGLPVYHEDITVYEVTRGGKHVGLWYFDPYAREGKRSGAWMNAYRTQERFKGEITTIVSNNSNFIKGAPGEPVLISWDDATTLFHEFGHAIHGLNANATYPTVSGTNVARDYVEFPSQLNEHWLPTPQVLSKFCVHYKTGEPIPQALVDKIKAAGTFNQGFDTTEYLASALIDMKLHLAGDVDIDPDKFEREELTKLGMPKEIVMRHRTPQFGHVFSGDGYSAGYYSYLWADTLTADVAEAFKEAPGGFYDKPTGQRLIETIMSKGNSVDPVDQFKAFRGRDVKIGALMRDRGFPVPPGA